MSPHKPEEAGGGNATGDQPDNAERSVHAFELPSEDVRGRPVRRGPHHTACRVEEQESPPGHDVGAGEDRRKRPQHGDEAPENTTFPP